MSNPFLQPGESFTLSATVRNQGTVAAPATTLRFYRSSDSTITSSDVELGSASVRALAPNATTELDITLTAPTSEGTYYYGGCVDAVGNEGRTDNNCSTAVEINVSTTPPFWIYWTDRYTGILRVVNDGTNRQFLVNTPVALSGIALDVEGGKMYWATNIPDSRIRRANLDGSNVEDIVTGSPEPYGIALDVAAGKMYWTSIPGSHIRRANLDGSNVEDIVTGLPEPYGIALDVAAGKMYWGNNGLLPGVIRFSVRILMGLMLKFLSEKRISLMILLWMLQREKCTGGTTDNRPVVKFSVRILMGLTSKTSSP